MSLGPEWIGSDHLPDLGRGEDANVTVARSGEVKARVQVDSEKTGDPSPAGPQGGRTRTRTTTYAVEARNLRDGPDAAVDIRIGFASGGHRTTVLDVSPSPSERHGDVRFWDRPLEGGRTATFHVTLERVEDF
ncbi:MAG TPA: hypothetical protein VHI93_03140 [Candidatus Thermoplasmatota archaeon]|nr:hypothetical protein [Candidatus Thermoplasmatota archaeon]